MKEIEVGGVIFEFPEKWSEISIRKYQKITQLKEDGEYYSNLSNIVSILSGIDIDILEDLPYTEFISIASNIKFIFEGKNDDPIKWSYVIDGVEYKLATDMTHMSTREFMDLNSFFKDKENISNNIHLILAIVYRPVVNGEIELYSTKDVFKRADLFLDIMTCESILTLMVFYSALMIAFYEHIQDSFPIQVK